MSTEGKKIDNMINLKRTGAGAVGIVVLLMGSILFTIDYKGGPQRSVSGYPSDADPFFIGQKAPDFRLMDVDGNWVSLFDFSGKVVIINFWATWCVPCRWEIPGFVEQQESYPDDLVIVGISMDEDGPDVVPPFMEQFGINYPVLYGDENVSRSYGGITGIPTSFVLDRNLVIQRVYIGYRPETVFEQDIEALISEVN